MLFHLGCAKMRCSASLSRATGLVFANTKGICYLYPSMARRRRPRCASLVDFRPPSATIPSDECFFIRGIAVHTRGAGAGAPGMWASRGEPFLAARNDCSQHRLLSTRATLLSHTCCSGTCPAVPPHAATKARRRRWLFDSVLYATFFYFSPERYSLSALLGTAPPRPSLPQQCCPNPVEGQGWLQILFLPLRPLPPLPLHHPSHRLPMSYSPPPGWPCSLAPSSLSTARSPRHTLQKNQRRLLWPDP